MVDNVCRMLLARPVTEPSATVTTTNEAVLSVEPTVAARLLWLHLLNIIGSQHFV